jgi:hypothetical protein
MINQGKREELEYEIENCIRGYGKAQTKRKEIANLLFELVRSGEDFDSAAINAEISDIEADLKYYRDGLEEAKAKYCKMIQGISLPFYE